MRRFHYLRDPLFLFGCAAYAVNRWVLNPHLHSPFLHCYFNDLFLIPCALPPLLLIQRWLKLRLHDGPPTPGEIIFQLCVWSILFEWIGPHIMPHTVGDPWDVLAYAGGGGCWFMVASAIVAAAGGGVVSFDILAPHYRWMEFVLAGEKLQRCRTAFLERVAGARDVLILGEGHGRFLVECRRKVPGARVTCVDASGRMLDIARTRLERAGVGTEGVTFEHADVLAWRPPERASDVLVTHFFLDCFRADQLRRIIDQLARTARPNASWLLADFQAPVAGVSRWRARLILKLMYTFFRTLTHLPAMSLTSPDPFMGAAGFKLQERQVTEWGLLRADHWIRN